jgi:hypothetical protein
LREKIYRSLNSSDLSDEEWENAAHVVASLGAAQINRKHLALGAMILHVRAGQAQFLPRVLALLSLRIASVARRSAWKGIGRHNADKLAQIAMDRFLDTLCGTCHGVGTVGELGQVIVICPECRGSQKRSNDDVSAANFLGIDWQQFKRLEIGERIKDVLAMLDRMEGYAAGGTKLQARGEPAI